MFNDFDQWEDLLFKKLTEVISLVRSLCLVADASSAQEYQTNPSKSVSNIEIQEMATGTERAATLRQADAALGEVIGNTILTAPGKPVKRHLGE